MCFVRSAPSESGCGSYLSITSTVQLNRSETEERERLSGGYFFAQRGD